VHLFWVNLAIVTTEGCELGAPFPEGGGRLVEGVALNFRLEGESLILV